MKWIARRLLTAWRTWRLRHDLYEDQPARHPALANIRENALIPYNGTHWRIAAIREQPCPVLILVPTGETRASAVRRLRELRRVDRIVTKDERTARKTLEKRAAS